MMMGQIMDSINRTEALGNGMDRISIVTDALRDRATEDAAEGVEVEAITRVIGTNRRGMTGGTHRSKGVSGSMSSAMVQRSNTRRTNGRPMTNGGMKRQMKDTAKMTAMVAKT